MNSNKVATLSIPSELPKFSPVFDNLTNLSALHLNVHEVIAPKTDSENCKTILIAIHPTCYLLAIIQKNTHTIYIIQYTS